MIRNGTRRKIFVLGILLLLAVGAMSVARADGEPVSIAAQVFQSNGDSIGSGYDGATAVVYVIDKDTGEQKTYDAQLEDGWVIVSVSADAISPGDKVRIKLDGGAWGDANHYVHAMGDENIIDFMYSGVPVLSIEAQSYKTAPMNLKPIIALIFIILILLFGFMFLAMMNRQKVNVVVTKKEKVRINTKQGVKETWKYTCSYGDPENLTELGFFHSDLDYVENSVLKISVRKLVKMPDGKYGWYDPKAVDMSKLPKDALPTAPDEEESINKKWFQGGGLALEKGQSMKDASRKCTHAAFTAYVYPFLVLELIFGLGSLFYEPFFFPPNLWVLIVNILILVFAMFFQFLSFHKATKEEKKEPEVAPAPVLAPVAAAPAAPAAPAKTACPSCKQEVGADFAICPYCGTSLK